MPYKFLLWQSKYASKPPPPLTLSPPLPLELFCSRKVDLTLYIFYEKFPTSQQEISKVSTSTSFFHIDDSLIKLSLNILHFDPRQCHFDPAVGSATSKMDFFAALAAK